ncbi:penicillin-binding transpeptidase domain-containing protein [Pseudoflavonifractor sp. MSJ-37]|uniref:penicillin-binding transpeptidase domain-containing protein n=1 Tax=Pseudoflavonifractor sp. MSJ-37 TaxID=2841531 RepID=UPI001C0F9D51|nr:penicillin-binding transpeptidase domain-containing protein [Pseudoflavonifractor sp. MSJ-37]MBU5436066.1 penicillin-binding protein [Pseudoflavonifractor sp. MSJ-37]
MDSKRFQRRLSCVAGIMAALFLLFLGVLYDLQIVHGADYRARSAKRNAQTETVEAVRGEILDSSGRVLVSNQASYQVTLDTSLMGTSEERNATLCRLLTICRERGMTWTDTLPVSRSAPYVYTMGSATGPQRRAFRSLMKILGENSTNWSRAAASGVDLAKAWGDYADALSKAQETTETGSASAALPEQPSDGLTAAALMNQMKSYFDVDPDLSEREARDLLGVLYELALRSKGASTSAYILAEDVDIDFITAVKEAGLKGVSIDATTSRVYNTTYAAHILGRVGSISAEAWNAEDSYYKTNGYNMNDLVGIDGMESAFERYLRGVAGTKIVERNSDGKVVSESWAEDPDTGASLAPQPGSNVVTTIDLRLQEALEQSLAARVPGLSSSVEGAAGVIVDMKGGVKAMASYPTFDLAHVYKDSALYSEAYNDPLKPFLNRATMGLYSPGSTFKMITGVAALQEGVTTPSEKIRDTGRFQYPAGKKYPYGDYHPACWALGHGYTHGLEDLAHALEDSCNIYFYTMADRMDIDTIDRYAAMFGLGKKTGIELSERSGYVAGPATSEALGQDWYGGLLLSAAIGQGTTLSTPLQLANYIATLVNGGDHYPAHLLQSVKSNDWSRVIIENDPEPLDQISISETNVEAVKRGMYLMANEGSVAKYFKDLPVKVGSKTGTAQVGRSDTEANAVFVCFAPYDDPEIAIALVAEHGGSGTELASVAADVLSVYFSQESSGQTVTGEGVLLR